MKASFVELGSVAEFINGAAFKPEDWGDEGKRIIRIQNLTDSTKPFNRTTRVVAEQLHVRPGDLLVSWSASLGVFEWNDPEVALLNQHIFRVVPDSARVEKRYLRHGLEGALVEMQRHLHGATMQHVNRGEFLATKLYLPPLAEQRRIAEVLDRAEALRAQRRAALAQLDILTQSLFLDLFGDPVSNSMGWEVKKLKDISTKILNGTTPKGGKQVYKQSGILFFRSQNVWRNEIVLEDIAYLDASTHRKMQKSSLRHKDILITKTGRINTENSSLGRAALFLGKDDSANINGHVYLVRLGKEVMPEFVLFILTTNEYREYIRRVCVGGIDKRQINKEHLNEFPVIFPPLDRQRHFAAIAEFIERQKTRQRAALAELDALFASLQHRAFRGEL